MRTVAIKRHPAEFRAKSMGDIMIDIDNRKQNYELHIDLWAKQAYEIAKQQVKFNTNSTRNQLPVFFRRSFMVIMYKEFNNRYSMNVCGAKMAELEGRKTPYNHCTLIHSLNRHIEAMDFPKGNQTYVDVFKCIYTELKRQSFLKRFDDVNNY